MVYFVVLGGTHTGEIIGAFRLINVSIAGVFVLAYFAQARTADRVDRVVLAGLLIFAFTSVLSPFPRQALDALLALVAYAAAFFAARGLLRDRRARRLLLVTIMALGLAVTVATASRQAVPVLEWMRLTEGAVAPPLALPFESYPWGNRYDAVLLAVMLYPAWLSGKPGRWRRNAAVVLGILLALLVVVSGSRNIWLATIGASAVVAIPLAVRRWGASRRVLMALAAVVVVVGLTVVTFEPLRDRLLVSSTIEQRWSMWAALVDAWTERPLTGYGPGSFPWILQTTDYFNTNTIAPRHPDSALFQLLGEAGLVGLTGAATVVVGVGWALVRSRHSAALWAVTVFLLGGLAANPSDFAFLIVVAICWTALALPREQVVGTTLAKRNHVMTSAYVTGLVIVAVAVGSTVAAGLLYDAAYLAIGREDPRSAGRSLEAAIALDPSMALYRRQAGTLHLLREEPNAAVSELQAAVSINPVDDLAWRTLSIALDRVGDEDGAARALNEAVEIQRSDPTNLLMTLARESTPIEATSPSDTVAELLLAWPGLAVAPGWEAMLPDELSSGGAIDLAVERWQRGGTSLEPITDQPLTLAALRRRPDLGAEAVAAYGLPATLHAPAIAVAFCDPASQHLVEDVQSELRQDDAYWTMVVRSATSGDSKDLALEALRVRTGEHADPERAEVLLNPLVETHPRFFNADRWGYRRIQIAWDDPGILLPDTESGATRLLLDWPAVVCDN